MGIIKNMPTKYNTMMCSRRFLKNSWADILNVVLFSISPLIKTNSGINDMSASSKKKFR